MSNLEFSFGAHHSLVLCCSRDLASRPRLEEGGFSYFASFREKASSMDDDCKTISITCFESD